jgi:ABC-type amino acid transport system permease subunit
MERTQTPARLAQGAPELIWVFVAAVGAAGVSLIVSGAGRAVGLAFGPALALGAIARSRVGNWRLAALVFVVVTVVLMVAIHIFGLAPHPSGSSRLGSGSRRWDAFS